LTKEEITQVFETHERQWTKLATMDELHWRDLPWPMIKRPANPEEITMTAISGYVQSVQYPDQSKPTKDRLKDHIRRWHPDRFETKLLLKVSEDERDMVKDGAGAVVRCLNELLTRSN
ncbi:hypothetical protein BDQ12DRAFT_567470, partial [Crucibulum laeve]